MKTKLGQFEDCISVLNFEAQCSRKNIVFEVKQTSIAILALPVTICVTLDKLLNTSSTSMSSSMK